MTLLWAAFAAMAFIGVFIVVIPIVRYRERGELTSELVNSLVYRDRLAELDQDLEQGLITATDYEQLKQELELTLLSDVAKGEDGQERQHSPGKWAVIALFVVIPLSAGFIYWSEGYRPEITDWFDTQQKMQKVMPLMMAGDYQAAEAEGIQVQDFVRSLQKHLQANTDDHRGWYLLGVSYMQLGLPQQAELGFRRALDREPGNTDYLMGFTQSSLAQNGGQITPEIRATLRAIISREPNNPKPYMAWGMALFQKGDYPGAIAIWQRYLRSENVDPQAAKLLQRSIEVAQAQQKQGDSVAKSTPAGQAAPEIEVTVQVSDQVKAATKPTDTLYIFAKAVEGPPMPLAVVRQPVADWPVRAVLNDSNAMTPAMTLSKFDQVVVQARISASGNAVAQSGDWIGPTQVVELKPGKQAVTLEINGQMP